MGPHKNYCMKYAADQEEKQKTYIVFCDRCGLRGHKLPHGYDVHGVNDLKHQGCGGCIVVSKTTTRAMLDALTDEQAAVLEREIADAIVRADRLRAIVAAQLAAQRSRC
ncbi:MAG: hypothetical protein ACI4MJ_11830 [Aristaeellaceae bacterium]